MSPQPICSFPARPSRPHRDFYAIFSSNSSELWYSEMRTRPSSHLCRIPCLVSGVTHTSRRTPATKHETGESHAHSLGVVHGRYWPVDERGVRTRETQAGQDIQHPGWAVGDYRLTCDLQAAENYR